jgi:hypothetical protein
MTGNWRTRSSESQKIRPRPHKPRVYTGAGSVVEYGKAKTVIMSASPIDILIALGGTRD